ncbi:ImmA/IrrE family metallo-endopeptidase [Sinorhizobium medicae]
MAVLRRSISAPRPPQEYGPEGAAVDARKIAQQNLLKMKPLDVFGLAAALGLQVVSRPLEQNTSGYLKKEGESWMLGVNSLHHPNRQRFTAAHEIGHYMLHRDHSSFVDGLLFRREAQYNQREREANLFASLLLMPEVEIKQALKFYDVPTVANMFGVSQQATQYRIDNLGNSAVYG